MTPDECFFHCEKCGKRLIKRLPNGLFHFAFGRRKKKDGYGFASFHSPVEILIYGSIKMKCMVEGCGHWTTFNFFPNSPVTTEQNDYTGEETKSDSSDNSL